MNELDAKRAVGQGGGGTCAQDHRAVEDGIIAGKRAPIHKQRAAGGAELAVASNDKRTGVDAGVALCVVRPGQGERAGAELPEPAGAAREGAGVRDVVAVGVEHADGPGAEDEVAVEVGAGEVGAEHAGIEGDIAAAERGIGRDGECAVPGDRGAALIEGLIENPGSGAAFGQWAVEVGSSGDCCGEVLAARVAGQGQGGGGAGGRTKVQPAADGRTRVQCGMPYPIIEDAAGDAAAAAVDDSADAVLKLDGSPGSA